MKKRHSTPAHPVRNFHQFLASCKVFNKGFGINVARIARKPPSTLVKLMMVVLSFSQPRLGGFPKNSKKNFTKFCGKKKVSCLMCAMFNAYCSRTSWETPQNSGFLENSNKRQEEKKSGDTTNWHSSFQGIFNGNLLIFIESKITSPFK